MKYTPEELAEACKRLNLRQQAKNVYTNISKARLVREARRARKAKA